MAVDKIAYRPEIDGLRAIAVVSVVFFHAQFSILDEHPFRGGFLGVDIFFVISGYLISTLILKELQAGTFSFARFYERRARRILPALFATVGVCLAGGFLLFSPADYERGAGAAVSALLGISNFYFLSEVDYFDADVRVKPLLHTWSLSVEEQFYLIFPPLLLAIRTFAPKRMTESIVVLLVASLLYAEYASTATPEASFFLLPMRGWELLAGALLAQLELKGYRKPHPTLDRTMPWLGLVLIFGAFLIFGSETKHPSVLTGICIVGTMMVIWFCRSGYAAHTLLSLKPVVGLGLISYSLYLLHWPIIVFAEYYLFRDLTNLERVIAVLVSVAAAILSFRYIEQPFRRRIEKDGVRFRRAVLTPALSTWVVLGIVSLAVWMNGGLPWRTERPLQQAESLFDIPKIAERVAELEQEWAHHRWVTIRKIGNLDEASVLILGDSHADHLVGLAEYLKQEYDVSTVIYSLVGCPPVFGTYKVMDVPLGITNPRPAQNACKDLTDIWQRFVAEHADRFDHVILASRWAWMFERGKYFRKSIRSDVLVDKENPQYDRDSSRQTFISGLRETVRSLRGLGVEPIVFGQVVNHERSLSGCDDIPRWFRQDVRLSRCETVPKEVALARLQWTNDTIRKIASEEGFRAVLPTDYFCDTPNGYCRTHYKGRRLSDDADHINRFGSIYLAHRWAQSEAFPFATAARKTKAAK